MIRYKKLEEAGILRNKAMADVIAESDAAKKKGIKTWELKVGCKS